MDGQNPFRTTWKPRETILHWYLQGNHHSMVSWVVRSGFRPSTMTHGTETQHWLLWVTLVKQPASQARDRPFKHVKRIFGNCDILRPNCTSNLVAQTLEFVGPWSRCPGRPGGLVLNQEVRCAEYQIQELSGCCGDGGIML